MSDTNLYPHPSLDGFIVLMVAFFIVGVIIRLISIFSLPAELLVTIVHEVGHVLAIHMTGGRTSHFAVSSDGGGYTQYKGGDKKTIIVAGYLGIALFSTILILLTGWPDTAPYTLVTLGALLIIASLVFGYVSLLTILVGVIFGLVFVWIALNLHFVWSILVVNIIAIQAGLITLNDLRVVAYHVTQDPQAKNDATDMAKAAGRSALFWARLWLLISVLLLGGALWFTWLRHLF